MQSSLQLKSCRGSLTSSQREYSSVNTITKTLTVSQSQGKTLSRYFYRRDSISHQKIQDITLRKSKVESANSFYKRNTKSKSKKTITDDNENSKTCEITIQPPSINLKREKSNEDSRMTLSKLEVLASQPLKISMRRTSDWKFLYYKNTIARKKNLESSQTKLKLETEELKERGKVSNMDLMIKKHKADNVKEIQQKLRSTMSRGGFKDTQKLLSIKDYNRKCGFNDESKVFIWNSEDEYIRRILLSWGWIHNQTNQSPFFHLKWTYVPSFSDARISEKQLQNHFKNSHELTSKSYLSKNLKANQSSLGQIDNYYPKCYDVGNVVQWNEFLDQYRQNIMLILLKKIYRLFVDKTPQLMNQYDLFYSYHFSRDSYCTEQKVIKNKNKSAFRNKGFREINMEDYKNRKDDFLVHIHLVVEALKYWRIIRKQKQEYLDQGYHFLEFNKANFISNFSQLEKYALMTDLSTPNKEANLIKQMFSTPSCLMIQRISKEFQFLKCTNSLFQTYGENNIWIVKPTSTSRGSGIYLTTNLAQIQISTKNIQSRLVQKYIQRPLIILQPTYPQLFMRKFDLRQWVLLKSIDPLQIYMFSQCYLRLCSAKYKLKNIQQLHRHLTNYSLNKQKFKNKQDSVLPLSYLKDVLRKQYNIQWQASIKPKIQEIVIKSIKSCIEMMDDYGGICFQLLGYDILIDQKMQPWLLQVNMSPACEERTQWIKEYLNDMGTGLLQLILPPEVLPEQIEYCKYEWQQILFEQSHFNRKREVELGLQITGLNVQLRNEKKIDMFLVKNKAALRIQSFFKTYAPKYQEYKSKQVSEVKNISKYMKGIAQAFKFQRLQKLNAINKICSYIKALPLYNHCQESIRFIYIGKISAYLHSMKEENYYEVKLTNYRRKMIIQLAQIILKKKKLHLFCREIISIGENVTKIQQKCRQFLKHKKTQRKSFEMYFRTLYTLISFEKRQKELLKEQNICVLNTYFKTLATQINVLKLINQSNKKIITKYLRSLVSRRQYYSKRLDIFLYSVGRVIRVSRRRTRCQHLKWIINEWVRQKYRSKIETINKCFETFIEVRRYRSIKISMLQQQRMLNIGRIKPNRK